MSDFFYQDPNLKYKKNLLCVCVGGGGTGRRRGARVSDFFYKESK